MTHPDLDELVSRARHERAAPGALTAVARSLRVPFLATPVAAVVVPGTAIAGVVTKAGLSRLMLLGYGAGSAVAVSGVVAAVALHHPPPRAPAPPVAAVAPPVSAGEAPKIAEIEPMPQIVPAPSSAPARVVKDVAATWDEPQLIERARRALASDPRRALALAQEHQRRFPAGALAVERDVITVEALARSGQTSEARRRALAFENKYPSSIHLPQMRALLARLGSR